MFFKKKRDKVRRCPNGHILDPSWDHCPYCEEGLEYTGEYSVSGNEEAPPPQPPPPAAPRPAAPPPAASPPPPAAPSPPPAAPPPSSSPSGSENYEDLTVVQMPPAAPRPAAPPPAAPPPAPGAPGSSEEPTVDTPPGGSRPVSPAPPPAAPSEPARIQPAPAGQESLVAWLIMTSGARRGQDWRLPARAVRIGKAPDCEIALPEEGYLSAHHAELAFDGTRFVVRDLGSTNGTSVNDRRVETSALEDGDRIVLGLTQFVFKCLRF